jgi:hypothetical protein
MFDVRCKVGCEGAALARDDVRGWWGKLLNNNILLKYKIKNTYLIIR